MHKSEIAAADYRRRASEALDAADGSGLAQVRDKLQAAAQAWISLAELEDRRALHAHAVAERIALRAEPAVSAAGCA